MPGSELVPVLEGRVVSSPPPVTIHGEITEPILVTLLKDQDPGTAQWLASGCVARDADRGFRQPYTPPGTPAWDSRPWGAPSPAQGHSLGGDWEDTAAIPVIR